MGSNEPAAKFSISKHPILLHRQVMINQQNKFFLIIHKLLMKLNTLMGY